MVMSLTHKLPLSRTRLDRDAEARKIPGYLDQLWADANTRVVLLWARRSVGDD